MQTSCRHEEGNDCPSEGTRRKAGRALVLILAASCVLLSACDTRKDYFGNGTMAVQTVAGLDVISVINTKKTLVDHAAGLMTGQDCSTIRAQQGYHWCREPYENTPIVPTLYCYKSLADIVCYDRPSPNPADILVGVRQGGLLPTD